MQLIAMFRGQMQNMLAVKKLLKGSNGEGAGGRNVG